MERSNARKSRELADMVNAANNSGCDCGECFVCSWNQAAIANMAGRVTDHCSACADGTCREPWVEAPAPVESADVEALADSGDAGIPKPVAEERMRCFTDAELAARDAAQQRIGAERELRDRRCNQCEADLTAHCSSCGAVQ